MCFQVIFVVIRPPKSIGLSSYKGIPFKEIKKMILFTFLVGQFKDQNVYCSDRLYNKKVT